jgi:hypothetical protein
MLALQSFELRNLKRLEKSLPSEKIGAATAEGVIPNAPTPREGEGEEVGDCSSTS